MKSAMTDFIILTFDFYKVDAFVEEIRSFARELIKSVLVRDA